MLSSRTERYRSHGRTAYGGVSVTRTAGGGAQRWVERFARGLLTLAQQYGATLAGGDTAKSPHGVLADIVVIGTVPRGEAVRRAGRGLVTAYMSAANWADLLLHWPECGKSLGHAQAAGLSWAFPSPTAD